MKIALVYDRINKWGGAERILLLLHEMFPDAPIYTSVFEDKGAPWAKNLDIRTSFLQKFFLARANHELFAPLMPLAFESFDFDGFGLVISLTSEAAKGVITRPHTRHICICLTPTRYLWSEYKTYFPNKLVRFITFPIIFYLRAWDRAAAFRPDIMLAISKTVQSRIADFYGRDSEILYPPLLLNQISSTNYSVPNIQDLGYFLVVSRLSRLSPHKKVGLAIIAANKLKLPLKVVGVGNTKKFKKMAGPTVEIISGATDEELASYYKNCAALIFPGVEDFGLVMVEAQAAGKPVLAYRSGGATEIIKEGKTGDFFEKQTVGSLVNRLKSFDKTIYNSKDCIDNAQRFSKNQFVKTLMEYVKTAKKERNK